MIATNYIPMQEVARIVVFQGARNQRAAEIVATCWAESGGNTLAINLNTHNKASKAYLSLDLGLCQWNTYWHLSGAFSIAMMFDPAVSLRRMIDHSDRFGLTPWNAYKNGLHTQYMPFAVQCVKNAGGW